MNNENTFNAFVRYQTSVASRLRYRQAIRNLETLHDLSKHLKILDAAGGNGLNSEHFLRANHEVVLLDSDPRMLAEAQRRLGAANLLEKCTLVEGTLESIREKLPASSFDLILCHHVLEYTNHAPAILASLHDLAFPGGTPSLITLNPVSEVIRAVVFRQDPALARSKVTDLGYDARWFGQATLYRRDQVETWAINAGWSLRDFRGIRILADYLPESETDDEKEREILDLENALAGLDPYRQFGRYFQFCFERAIFRRSPK